MRILLSLAALLSVVVLTGCMDPLPKPPAPSEYRYVDSSMGNFNVYHTHNSHRKEKNLIFIAGDDTTQFAFADKLKVMYNSETPPRLEDIVWWHTAPDFFDMYGQVIQVPYDEVKFKNLEDSLAYMEAQGKPYDLFILSYGIPNHLMTGEDGYFLSWEELQGWKGQWQNLELVYMQACYGTTLIHDWMEAGADQVISFMGFHRNFLYPAVFLDWYKERSVGDAHMTAVRTMRWKVAQTPLYKFMIEDGLGISLQEYWNLVDSPRYVFRPSEAPQPDWGLRQSQQGQLPRN